MSFYTEKYIPYKPKKIIQDSLPGMLSTPLDAFTPMMYPTSTGKRAAFCTLRNASLTVEAALVLPLFFLALLSIFSMLDFYRVYMEESMGLYEKARKTAIYTYHPDNLETIQQLYPDGYVTLSETVNYEVPFSPFPLSVVHSPCQARVHLWCGALGTELDSDIQPTEVVYITDEEEVFHTSSSCTHLELTIRKASLSSAQKSKNQDGSRYHACEICIGSGIAQKDVYLSERGTAYHNTLSCSGLKRSVHLVPKSDIIHRRICSRCQKNS